MGNERRPEVVAWLCFYYGLFLLCQGTAVFAFFGDEGGPGEFDDLGAGLVALDAQWLGLALAALCVSHGLSFWRNHLVGGEYLTLSPEEAMRQALGRVLVLQVTIIVGAMLVAVLGSPVWALVLLVALKIGLDLRAHLAERRKAIRRWRRPVAPPSLSAAGCAKVRRTSRRQAGHEAADEEVSG